MLGLCSITFRDKTVDEVITLVKKADLDAIEWGSDIHVPGDDPVEGFLDSAETLKRLVEVIK